MQHYKIVNNKWKASGRKWLRPNLMYFSAIYLDRTERSHEKPQSGQSEFVHEKYQAVRNVLPLCLPRQGNAAPHIAYRHSVWLLRGTFLFRQLRRHLCRMKVDQSRLNISAGRSRLPLTKQPSWKNEECQALFGYPTVLQYQNIIKRRGTALIPSPITATVAFHHVAKPAFYAVEALCFQTAQILTPPPSPTRNIYPFAVKSLVSPRQGPQPRQEKRYR